MAQNRVAGKTGRSGGGGGGGPTSASKGNSNAPTQLLLIDLKHRILAALNKLADRDTQQLAVEELERIAESVSPESLSLLLTCLYDTDAQQKSVVRRECVKLFGTLASLHGDLLAPHLSKIVTNIVRRLKDPDSNIRDACVESIGILASQVGAGAENGSAIGVFVKPLFEALSEQNRNLQVGAALCLARVIDLARDPPPATLQRLCPRIVKLLSSPNFLAKSSLLTVVGSLAQSIGVRSSSQLAVLVTSAQEALESNEWATRKAAADMLACVATGLGSSLTTFKSSCCASLEACRFDKVKPVRDSVVEALQVWKAIPDAADSHMPPPPPSTTTGKGETCSTTSKKSDITKLATELSTSHTPRLDATETDLGSECLTEKGGSVVKKRTPTISDKKTNPDFFRKLETARNLEQTSSGDWQIEVVVPPGHSPRAGSEEQDSEDGPPETEQTNGRNLEYDDSQERSPTLADGFGGFVTPKEANPSELQEKPETGRQLSVPTISPTSSVASYDDDAAAAASGAAGVDLVMLCQQFHNLEQQQCTIMEMLQEFMSSVHDNMQGLEGRVHRLECVVDGMANSATLAVDRMADRMASGNSPRFEHGTGRPFGKFLTTADFASSRMRKGNENPAAFSERVTNSTPWNRSSSRESSWKAVDSTSETWDGFTHGAGLSARMLGNSLPEPPRRPNHGFSSDPTGKLGRDNLDGEQVGNRRAWDRGAGPVRHGEGPSARSIWSASKDEATLAAIRGAPPPDKLHHHDTSTAVKINTGNKDGGSSWMQWSRAAEYVRMGEMEAAYVEILGTGEELLLLRLLSRTGPVLEQLSSGTVLHVVCTLTQLLQQQSVLDCVLPWIQQVSDLTRSNGADCLGLSAEVKKHLVSGLQDASTMNFSESWMASTAEQLALQLANAWSIDIGISE
ncbi:unnamed protein product [Sphagnum compactum]